MHKGISGTLSPPERNLPRSDFYDPRAVLRAEPRHRGAAGEVLDLGNLRGRDAFQRADLAVEDAVEKDHRAIGSGSHCRLAAGVEVLGSRFPDDLVSVRHIEGLDLLRRDDVVLAVTLDR